MDRLENVTVHSNDGVNRDGPEVLQEGCSTGTSKGKNKLGITKFAKMGRWKVQKGIRLNRKGL